MRSLFLIAVIGGWCLTVPVMAQTGRPVPSIQLEVKDLTPKFLQFYQDAAERGISEPQRWALWKKEYDFAAVPPTPQGDSIARALLDKAWPRYPPALGVIEKGASALQPVAEKILARIDTLLHPDSIIAVRLLVFVGGFDDNAFTVAQSGKITTAIAVETTPASLPLLMAHELTHAVHMGMGSIGGGWQRTIGTTALSEGLAMRVTQQIFPGHPDKDYVEYTPGWLAKAEQRRKEILTNIRPSLSSDSIPDIMRFTMGTGPSGLEREAYYAGWLVVGYWLTQGMSFADIARIREKDMPQRVGAAVDALLQQIK